MFSKKIERQPSDEGQLVACKIIIDIIIIILHKVVMLFPKLAIRHSFSVNRNSEISIVKFPSL